MENILCFVKLTNLKSYSMLASLCWRHDSCCRIRFVSPLFLWTHCLLHTSFMMRTRQYTQGFYYSSVWLCSVSSRQSLTLLQPYLFSPPLTTPSSPGANPPFSPQPLSLISLMHGLLYINPPLLKRRISILLGRGWLRRDHSASGLSACRKSRRPALWNTPIHFWLLRTLFVYRFPFISLLLLYFWNAWQPSAAYGTGPMTCSNKISCEILNL
jgi:hypothetical protein